MLRKSQPGTATAIASIAAILVACSADSPTVTSPAAGALSFDRSEEGSGSFKFTPLASSAVCTIPGGNPVKPFVIPAGYEQEVIASEPDYADAGDMNTQNENGPQAGRYLYRPHEAGSNATVSVTDLKTGVTKTIAQRADWESFDPSVWTPWGTLLVAEETNAARVRDPQYPHAVGGLVYELVPSKSDPSVIDRIITRPAIGAKAHEGMRFDPQGNLYSISERTPGYIFKFIPDRKGDLSSGQTYVLHVVRPDGDRTGDAEWIPLDRAAVQIDASAAADAVGATGYGRPEDVETATSTGNDRGGSNVLYVAITSEHRVLAIDLHAPNGEADHGTARVSDYVRVGLNVGPEFSWPDNLALDRAGNLYIAEDPGGSFATKRQGDDIWVAAPNKGSHGPAASVVRFASLTDCDAEPTGIYFDLRRDRLFVNAQHRGGDGLDKTMAIQPLPGDE